MTKISVVIPALDAEATLPALLDALEAQAYEGAWEVVVADNGSSDATHAVAESYRGRLPGLRVVDASAHRGPAHARNVGARAALGDALAFVDADDLVDRGWLAAVAAALAHHDFVASQFDVEVLNEPWLRRSRGVASPGERLGYPPFVPHAGACGMAVDRELFLSAGGFDESLPIAQDTDLCVRLQLAGSELHHAPDAIVHVRYRSSVPAIYRQARAYAWDNARLYARYSDGSYPARDWGKWPFRHWKAITGAAIRAYGREGRARLAWAAGWQVGRVLASFRYQVPAK
jgi:glycosyltransferase involved in cell wall biosynthesis